MDDLCFLYDQNEGAQKIIFLYSAISSTIQNGKEVSWIHDRFGYWTNEPRHNNREAMKTTKDLFNFDKVTHSTCGDYNGDGLDDLCFLYDQNEGAQMIIFLYSAISSTIQN
ncbi:MAG: hypothetical protein GF331_22655, partial [Chitinivibrionales bacterium]|nr:hypothetical protein [Chitinivibrionales bacterium]